MELIEKKKKNEPNIPLQLGYVSSINRSKSLQSTWQKWENRYDIICKDSTQILLVYEITSHCMVDNTILTFVSIK